KAPLVNHTATLLPDGTVLIAGGFTSGGSLPAGETNTAEIYSPFTGTFAFTGSMATAREAHTATFVPQDEVDNSPGILIAGGFNNASGALNSGEIYRSATGVFSSPLSSMVSKRCFHTATPYGS